jgi:hypothetical protein
MSAPPKETVIIVHGTWAAPEPGSSQWYQPVDHGSAADGFISKLNNALQECGSTARCWAHCTPEKLFFRWSGENSWTARMQAATALAAYVHQLRSDGWCCHIVAHSHGGNIVVDALSQIAEADQAALPLGIVPLPTPFIDAPSKITAARKALPPLKVVTLGTPFIDVRSPVSERRRKVKGRRAAFFQSALRTVLLTVALMIAAFISHGSDPDFAAYKGYIVLVGALGCLFFLAVSAAYQFAAAIWFKEFWKSDSTTDFLGKPSGIKSRLLALGSRKDEPWQVLHHIRSIENPFKPSENLMRYVFSSLRLRMNAAADADAALGARPFKELEPSEKASSVLFWSGIALFWTSLCAYKAFKRSDPVFFIVMILLGIPLLYLSSLFSRDKEWWIYSNPRFAFGRWQVNVVGGLLGLPTDVLTYFIRRKSWPVLVAIAMGLEHYRFELPRVEQLPKFRLDCITSYEELPTGVLERAMLKRGDKIVGHLRDVSDKLENLVVTVPDITSWLREAAGNQHLIHASYYTDDECIARIADWIAGRR